MCVREKEQWEVSKKKKKISSVLDEGKLKIRSKKKISSSRSFREFSSNQIKEKHSNGEKHVVGYNWKKNHTHIHNSSLCCLLGRSNWAARTNQQEFWSVCWLKKCTRCLPLFFSSAIVVLKGFPCWDLFGEKINFVNARKKQTSDSFLFFSDENKRSLLTKSYIKD